MTVGVTPNFIAGHPESTIDVILRDSGGAIIERWNLADDFTFVDDATFTNSTYRHYQRAQSINYPFLATLEVWLTEVQSHFRFDPSSVDVTPNVTGLLEHQLEEAVQEKLNRAIPDQGVTYAEIEDRLEPIISVTHSEPDGSARFATYDGTGAYPTQLSDFTQVPSNNPQFTNNNTGMFVATVQPQFGLFVTEYTSETDLVTPVTLRPGGINVSDLPTSATGLASGDLWNNSGTLAIAP